LKIWFCSRPVARAALHLEIKFIVAGASSQIVGRVTRRFRRRAEERPKCGRPGRHGNKQLLKALLRARHTHALAGVECRTHPWSAWVGLGTSISIYVPHLSRDACSCRPHVYVYTSDRVCPCGRSRVFDYTRAPGWCAPMYLRRSALLPIRVALQRILREYTASRASIIKYARLSLSFINEGSPIVQLSRSDLSKTHLLLSATTLFNYVQCELFLIIPANRHCSYSG